MRLFNYSTNLNASSAASKGEAQKKQHFLFSVPFWSMTRGKWALSNSTKNGQMKEKEEMGERERERKREWKVGKTYLIDKPR